MAGKQTLEKAMKQLEQIVQDLESGDLPLEKAVRKFEEGIRLSRFCTATLDETERKISLLIADPDGTSKERPFLPDEDTDDPV